MKLLTTKQIVDDILETPMTQGVLVMPPFIESEKNHVRVMQNLQMEAMVNPSNLLIAKIRKLCRKYPEVPVLKNLQMQVLVSLGYEKKAKIVLDESIIQHPEYLTSKLNKSTSYFSQGQAKLMHDTLGGELTLRGHLPTRPVFHCSEISNFYKVVGLYYFLIEDTERLGSVIDALESLAGMEKSDIRMLKNLLRNLL